MQLISFFVSVFVVSSLNRVRLFQFLHAGASLPLVLSFKNIHQLSAETSTPSFAVFLDIRNVCTNKEGLKLMITMSYKVACNCHKAIFFIITFKNW